MGFETCLVVTSGSCLMQHTKSQTDEAKVLDAFIERNSAMKIHCWAGALWDTE